MEIFWFGTLAVLLIGYFALEGFDIGLGMLLPVLGRSRADRDRLVGAMAPFVLAGEVWLVALAGVLFGAFPALEGEVLSGLYPLVVSLLVAWILRDAGLWFRRRVDGPRSTAAWRSLWDWAVCLGSAGLALTWGMALVAMAHMAHMAHMATGMSGPLLDPLSAAGGVVVATAFCFHGWTFAAWRLPGDPAARGAVRTGWGLLLSACAAAAPAAVAVAFLASAIVGHAAPPETLSVLSVMVLPFAPILVGAQVWVWRTFSRGAVPTFF
ncbi:cytochrome d ubiquinol oxidase subunit II [Planotetraspora sp. GP83]|uniref:cytochrome d ubiquinol oxidase subunit II n=1 Tax=Planotetraspora sp. GP83 TaxID=3156264 RepID=UPI0035188608